MDRRKAGRRRSSPEIVTEGKRKKTSSSELHKITKILDAKPEDARVKPPLSKLRSSERWDLPLQGWERSRRNNVLSLDCKSKKGVRGRPVTSKTSSERQLKVMLTNVLWTELGRKFRKILPRNDANLCDANKVQSDSLPSTSVDSLETCQKLEPLHQSLKLSERIPRVILTNVLGTDLGRKYIKTSPVTEATLGDTDNLQSEQLSSSSDDSLESCQNLNPHKSFFLNERGSQSNKTVDKNCSRRATQIKEKRKGNDGISLVVSDTQSKDLNSESRGCDHLEEGSRNKNGTCSDSKMEPTLISRKRKKRLRSNSPDSHNSTSLYKPAELTKEQENDSTVSSEFEKLNENHDQNPKLLKEITPEPMESDFTELSSLDSQELALSAAPKSTSDCSVTETVVENSVSTDTLGNTTQVEKDENKMNTIEKPVLSEHSEGNQSLISAEPIVVSSDEEGPIEHKNSEILKLQSKQDHNVTKENESISESALSELPSITCESVQASSELCPAKENISCIMPSNEMDLQLDFIFTSVYIGKIKGASKGCVTFTPKYVKIPFQVSLNEVLLLVDTTHLKRFGLWKSKDDDHSKRSLAILFLWVSSHYLQDIQTQLENSMLSQQSKSSEFIFLELHNPISQREELKLKDIMTEISTTTGEVELSYPLSWVQAFPLFQNLSSKESSFIHYYCASTCSFFAAAAEEIKMQSVSQPSNVDAAKPNYTFLQKQSSGCYSLSITTNPDEEWREVRHTGPVQKLIVYPPPPTKGGLGVTSEDLECLEEGEFLNDVIIDFYLKMAQRRHRRVRTWTRNINIFNKDYIFVPVNESSHWYLAVICFPWLEEAVYEDFPQTISQQSQAQQSQHNKTIDKDLRTTSVLSLGTVDSQSTETSMSIPKKVCKRPCILILDSLKAASIQNTVQNLREYLEVEWEVKRKTHREFSKTNMVDLCPKVPKQDNSSDCGVYLLQYVESFFKDPIVNFELPIHLEKWFPRHVIKTKREDIRELILKLHLQQQKASSS
ncbi:sentrin-specific protease 7 isoform X5 [Pipistrellus kuhlii]|uniref:sentrin-specific protease 7 isoform X5 n=1 Tax=Pipistrellus kuhlii TaxID=59472 RepID=UPI00174EFD92|nr:sentrin-specific protease 7 isoform X5 [Pipistrellus kuhlii]